jgi:hypothetical protein
MFFSFCRFSFGPSPPIRDFLRRYLPPSYLNYPPATLSARPFAAENTGSAMATPLDFDLAVDYFINLANFSIFGYY